MFEIKSEPVSFLVYLKPQCPDVLGIIQWVTVSKDPALRTVLGDYPVHEVTMVITVTIHGMPLFDRLTVSQVSVVCIGGSWVQYCTMV